MIYPGWNRTWCGRKMLLAEVQQSSDVTYRIYDYDNTEPDGLHHGSCIWKKHWMLSAFPHKEPEMNIRDELHGNNHIFWKHKQ